VREVSARAITEFTMNTSTTRVLLCPGQGSQSVGMGIAWADASPAASEVFAIADDSVQLPACAGGRTISQVCREGPKEVLDRTDVAQVALFTAAVACARALAAGDPTDTPAAMAGLSLGEYTALHLAGALTLEDGLRLVAERGRLMQSAAEATPSGMVALIGADEAAASDLCLAAAGELVLVCANLNCPGQIVISGDEAACDRAVLEAASRGLRATKLAVAGAFHSPLMASAAHGMRAVLSATPIHPLRCPVWSNVTARPHLGTPDSIRELLVRQLTEPVRWGESCQHMLESLRADRSSVSCLELAPGTVLKGLMRRIDRTCEVTSHDAPATTAH